MKIKRFNAKTMREAMRLVREEQGPDAVILGSHRSTRGVEVVAAVDYDASLMQQAARIAPTLPSAQLAAIEPRREAAPKPAPAPVKSAPAIETVQQARAVAATVAQPAAPTQDQGLLAMRRELVSLRRLLESQLGTLAWEQTATKAPRHAAVLRSLAQLAIAPQLSRTIATELPATPLSGDAERLLPLALLSRRLAVAKTDLVLDGGWFAFVGPTGVGKTTTLAKLAARYAARFGARDMALVTTDTFRVGAQEQLYTYARLLGVPVFTAHDAGELKQVFTKLADRKLVLVDTAGMAPRDRNLAAQFGTLSGAAGLKTLLVLSANAQAADLDDAVRKFAPAKPGACILTKLDEASRIGGALSTAIRHQLPVAYVCDGQRVPEDVQQARADHLVLRAQSLAQSLPAALDDDTLALRFGASSHAGL